MIYTQLIVLFGLMAIGYFANKNGVLDDNSDRSISKFLVNIAIPGTIISSSVGQQMEDKMKVFTVFATAIAVFLIIPLISFFLVKIFKLDNTYQIMLNYSNLGFMGIPIIASIYGESAVFYVSIYMMIFNVSLFSYGVSLVQKGSSHKRSSIFRQLFNPGIVSALLAVCLFVFEVSLPPPITKIIQNVGNITTPLAMIVIGSTLAAVKIKELLKDKRLYLFAFLKIMIIPILIWLILRLFIYNSTILGIAIILSSLPTAGNVSMLCMEYEGNVEVVTKGIFMSTIFSLVTIPILLLLF